MTFHPLPVLALLNLAASCWAIICLLYYLRSKATQPSFDLAALGLTSSLNIFAFLTGFTIGAIFAIVAMLIEIILSFRAKYYKTEILFSVIISLLLLLYMLGTTSARVILIIALALMTIWEGLKAKIWLIHQQLVLPILIILAFLFGISLLIPPKYAALLSLIITGIGLASSVRSKEYLWQKVLITVGSLLWLLNTTLYLNK